MKWLISKVKASESQLRSNRVVSYYDACLTDSLLPQSQFSALHQALPSNVHLLTLAQWEPDSVLIRLEHQFERGESANGSMPAVVNLLVGLSCNILHASIYFSCLVDEGLKLTMSDLLEEL